MDGINEGEGACDRRLVFPLGAHGVLAAGAVLRLDADRRAGVGDGAGEARQPRGEDLHQPAALALPPDADARRVDRRIGAQPGDGRERLVGAAFERVVAPVPRGSPAAGLVEGEGSDAAPEEGVADRREVAVGVAIGLAGPLEHQNGRVGRRPRRQVQAPRDGDAAPVEGEIVPRRLAHARLPIFRNPPRSVPSRRVE
jgi:hypothetical protein